MVGKTEIGAQGDNSERVTDLYGDTSPYGKLCYCLISNGLYETEGWYCFPVGFVNLNVHASFELDLLRGTMGVVLKDNKGRFLVGGIGR